MRVVSKIVKEKCKKDARKWVETYLTWRRLYPLIWLWMMMLSEKGSEVDPHRLTNRLWRWAVVAVEVHGRAVEVQAKRAVCSAVKEASSK